MVNELAVNGGLADVADLTFLSFKNICIPRMHTWYGRFRNSTPLELGPHRGNGRFNGISAGTIVMLLFLKVRIHVMHMVIVPVVYKTCRGDLSLNSS